MRFVSAEQLWQSADPTRGGIAADAGVHKSNFDRLLACLLAHEVDPARASCEAILCTERVAHNQHDFLRVAPFGNSGGRQVFIRAEA